MGYKKANGRKVRSCRLFVEDDLAEGLWVRASSAHMNYLMNTLRLQAGDEILLFNGRDGEWRARLHGEKRRQLKLELLEQQRAQPSAPIQENRPSLHYLFAPLKRARMDYLVQKATELGVCSLQPVWTRRTNAKAINYEKMQANMIEAAQQCGILDIPKLREMVTLEAYLDSYQEEDGVLVFCDEQEAGQFQTGPVEILSGIGKVRDIFVLIGPEGGFAPEERQSLRALKGSIVLPLGPRILRGDTAAVSALTLVNAVLGDWKH